MEKNNYISKLQKKCNLSDDFIKIINLLFEKLVNFGYITKFDLNTFSKKLYNNINIVILGNKDDLDFKTGYYDPTKKELYIKDFNNTAAVFLRLLYVLTTTENLNNTFSNGYSKVSKSKKSYKVEHNFFGLNRAVISNIVCRLLYTLPESLSLIPTYRTYQNNFLGTNFFADNDIYFLEGKLLRQICYIYKINEEDLYTNLFKTKSNKLKVFETNNLDNDLLMLDNISRTYSNYNKLCFLNKLLTDNYLQIKKYAIKNPNSKNKFVSQEKNIIRTIKNVISKITTSNLDIDDNNLEISLNETLDNLENKIISEISMLQSNILNYYINNNTTNLTLSKVEYVKNLKTIEDMLIIRNKTLLDEVFTQITTNIIHTDENSCTNLISKIKYSLVNYMIGKDKYNKLFEDLKFNTINEINKNDDDICIIINSGLLNEIAYVNGLCNNMNELNNNLEFMQSKNLKYLLNTNTKQSSNIERMFTKLVNEFKEFKNITINDVYMYDAHTEKLLLVITDNKKYVILLEDCTDDFKFKLLNLSEDFNLIPQNANLPVLYKKSKLSKIFNLFKLS